MKKRNTTTNENAILLDYAQACERYQVGKSTVMSLCREAGALVKIGKTARIDRVKMDSYILGLRGHE